MEPDWPDLTVDPWEVNTTSVDEKSHTSFEFNDVLALYSILAIKRL